MSNNSSHMHLVSDQSVKFTRPIGLHVEGGWVFIETISQASCCLNKDFNEKNGPSYLRAVTTCSAAMAGKLSADAVQATLIVAAMEAGYSFEVFEGDGLALEREVEAAAARGLEDLFLAEAAE